MGPQQNVPPPTRTAQEQNFDAFDDLVNLAPAHGQVQSSSSFPMQGDVLPKPKLPERMEAFHVSSAPSSIKKPLELVDELDAFVNVSQLQGKVDPVDSLLIPPNLGSSPQPDYDPLAELDELLNFQ